MSFNDIKTAFFLSVRYIKGASIWTISLIVFVMLLTFLNLVVISGILEGIVVGSFEGVRNKSLGDVYISSKEGKSYIERTQQIAGEISSDERVKDFSIRSSVSVEAITENDFYNVLNSSEKRKSVNTRALGIDPIRESSVTGLDKSILEGEYFSKTLNRNELIIGSALLERYSPFGADVLSGVYPGDFLYIRIGEGANAEMLRSRDLNDNFGELQSGTLKKYLVKGVYRTKASEFDLRLILRDEEVRPYANIVGNNSNSIAIRLFDRYDDVGVKKNLIEKGFSKYAKIQTVNDAIGPFLNDIRTIFKLLGSIVSGIGLSVSSITIFIIIFVTATSRKKFIGILKAIGISPTTIKLSYVFFALFFAIVGLILGLLLLYFVLIPYFIENPIPFPFSDGILYATVSSVIFKGGLLLFATLVAGFIPAHKITKLPAIDAVRGK